MTFILDLLNYTISGFIRLDNTTQNSIWVPESVHIWQYVKNVRSSKLMAIANYTKRMNGMRSIPQSLPMRSSKNYLKNNARKIYDTSWYIRLVLILRALMHHLSGIFGLWIGWGMTKNHLRIVSRERSLKCMLCSKCNGRLLLTFFGQKGREFSRPRVRGGLPGPEVFRRRESQIFIFHVLQLFFSGALHYMWIVSATSSESDFIEYKPL